MGIRYEECGVCNGAGKVQGVDPMDNSVITVGCNYCFGEGRLPVEYIASPLSASVRDPVPHYNVKQCPDCKGDGCGRCGHSGAICVPVDEGRLVRAAADVMRAQRQKGIAKYKSTLEDQNGYTVGGMIDMVAEELADGSVYVQKVREMYLALLNELEAALYIREHDDADRSDTDRITDAMRIISRERGNVG
ncbi:hypothetical protein CPT_Silvanus_046 [Stenotrophomonas phage Silvanus]|nr:hypothetical protein CPT_Silvanus_046 [Stenotrophomonas phage Silvanus]